MRYRLQEISDGLAGTDQTVARMAEFVRNSLLEGQIRLTALSIIERANVPRKDDVALARSLFEWVRSHVRYVRDPVGVETVQAPDVTLRLLAGDCDDQSVLLAALAMSVGLAVRWRVIGESPQNFSHIYLEILADGRWCPADTTLKNRFGQAPPHSGATKVYNFKGETAMLGQKTTAVAYPLATSKLRRVRARPLRPRRLTSARGGGRGVGMARSTAARLIGQAVKATLTDNWRSGLINRNDLLSYLRVIREGNAPFTGSPFFENHITAAIKRFHKDMDARGIKSFKPEGQIAGLGEMDGFLKSIWNGVKSVVRTGVSLVTGGGVAPAGPVPTGYPAPVAAPAPLIRLEPQINFPQGLISTIVPPETGKAAVTEFLTSPLFLGGLAIAALGVFMLARK